ncbi:unnamed protein product, partial [Callosobruchus maculatus]
MIRYEAKIILTPTAVQNNVLYHISVPFSIWPFPESRVFFFILHSSA